MRYVLPYAVKRPPRSVAWTATIVASLLGAYLCSYYAWAREQIGADAFLVDYGDTSANTREILESLHHPLVWIDSLLFVRCYQLPSKPAPQMLIEGLDGEQQGVVPTEVPNGAAGGTGDR